MIAYRFILLAHVLGTPSLAAGRVLEWFLLRLRLAIFCTIVVLMVLRGSVGESLAVIGMAAVLGIA